MNFAMLAALAYGCAEAAFAAGPAVAGVAAAAAPAVLAQADAAVTEAKPVAAETGAVSAPEAAPEHLVFAGETDKVVVDRVLAYIDAITTLQGDFTQSAPSGAISTGKFYLRRPGLLRFEYDDPSPLLIVANGGLVYVRDDALETTDSYPVGKTPLKFLLNKRVDLKDAKIISVDRGTDSVAITFSSTEEETEGELSVILDAPDLKLAQWIVRDPQNGVTIVSLENTLAGERLANRLFEAPDAESPFLKN